MQRKTKFLIQTGGTNSFQWQKFLIAFFPAALKGKLLLSTFSLGRIFPWKIIEIIKKKSIIKLTLGVKKVCAFIEFFKAMNESTYQSTRVVYNCIPSITGITVIEFLVGALPRSFYTFNF